jgi:hypothetical protein
MAAGGEILALIGVIFAFLIDRRIRADRVHPDRQSGLSQVIDPA